MANHILCIGAAHVDRKASAQTSIQLKTSIPVSVHTTLGGVARNVAENLARLECPVTILSRVGRDKEGDWVRTRTQELGIHIAGLTRSDNHSTASYTALLDGTGEMVLGLADMEIYDELTPEEINSLLPLLLSHPVWFLDTNLPQESLEELAALATGGQLLFVDPVSIAKTAKLVNILPRIDFLFPNREEAEVLSGHRIETLADAQKAGEIICEKGVKHVIITLGEEGVCVVTADMNRIFPALPAQVQDVTGAGDALLGGFLYGYLSDGSLEAAIAHGIAAATLTIETPETVHPALTPDLLHQKVQSVNLHD